MMKPFAEWTFNDLLQWARGTLIISIGEGRFQSATWEVVNQAIIWAEQEREKERARFVVPPRRKRKTKPA